MKEQILEIAEKLRLELITEYEAQTLLLGLFGVIGSFRNDKEHLCWANADFNNKCFICGKENCH